MQPGRGDDRGEFNSNWRATLSQYVESTEGNLKSLRRDSHRYYRAQDSNAGLQRAVVSTRLNAVDSAKTELGSLLAAVQGSLSELRTEVAAAKRLSNSATAAVADLSPVPRGSTAGVGSSGAASRPVARPMPAHGASPGAASPLRPRSMSVAPVSTSRAAPAIAWPDNGSAGASAKAVAVTPTAMDNSPPRSEDIIQVIDQRMSELGKKIERGLAKGAGASEPLVMLSMAKAEAAEKMSTEVRAEMTVLEKQVTRTHEDLDKKLTAALDASKQHWERICLVSSHVDSLAAQRSEVVSELGRLDNRAKVLEDVSDRAAGQLEEQQQVLLALTSAAQKSQQDNQVALAYVAKHDVLAKQLEQSVQRIQEIEGKLAALSESSMAAAAAAATAAVAAQHRSAPAVPTETPAYVKKLENRLQSLEDKAKAAPDVSALLVQRITALELSQKRRGVTDDAAFNARFEVAEEISLETKRELRIMKNQLGDVAQLRQLVASLDERLQAAEARTSSAAGAATAAAAVAAGSAAAAAKSEASQPRSSPTALKGWLGSVLPEAVASPPAAPASEQPSSSTPPSSEKIQELEQKLAALEAASKNTRVPEVNPIILNRLARLEGRVFEESSRLEKVAEEARLCVAEELAQEASRDLREVKETLEEKMQPSIIELEKQVQELKDKMEALSSKETPKAAATVAAGAGAGAAVAAATASAMERKPAAAPAPAVPAALKGWFGGLAPETTSREAPALPAEPTGEEPVDTLALVKELQAKVEHLEKAPVRAAPAASSSRVSEANPIILKRLARLEEKVLNENSLDKIAEEARLCVAEELAQEATRDLREVKEKLEERLEPGLEELKKQLQELGMDELKRQLQELTSKMEAQTAAASAATGAATVAAVGAGISAAAASSSREAPSAPPSAMPAALKALLGNVTPEAPLQSRAAPAADAPPADADALAELRRKIEQLEKTAGGGSRVTEVSPILLNRIARLEDKLKPTNSLDKIAEEARLCVAEELAQEATRDLREVKEKLEERLEPGLEELKKQLQELGMDELKRQLRELQDQVQGTSSSKVPRNSWPGAGLVAAATGAAAGASAAAAGGPVRPPPLSPPMSPSKVPAALMGWIGRVSDEGGSSSSPPVSPGRMLQSMRNRKIGDLPPVAENAVAAPAATAPAAAATVDASVAGNRLQALETKVAELAKSGPGSSTINPGILFKRLDRIEAKVFNDHSLEKIADEARLCVAEEMAREAVNGLQALKDGELEEIKKQVDEVRSRMQEGSESKASAAVATTAAVASTAAAVASGVAASEVKPATTPSKIPSALTGWMGGVSGSGPTPDSPAKESVARASPSVSVVAMAPAEDVLSRVKDLEERLAALQKASAAKDTGVAGSVNPIVLKRLERLERKVLNDNNLDDIAQEARLCVAEEMAREAVNDIQNKIDPAIEELQRQLAELSAAGLQSAAPPAGAVADGEVVQKLQDSVEKLEAQLADLESELKKVTAAGGALAVGSVALGAAGLGVGSAALASHSEPHQEAVASRALPTLGSSGGADVSRLQQELNELQSEMANLQDSHQQVASQASQALDKVQGLGDVVLQSEYAQLQLQVQHLAASIDALKGEMVAVAAATTLREGSTSVSEAVLQLEEEVAQLQEQLGDLSAQVEKEAGAGAAALSEQVAQHGLQLAALQAELQALQQAREEDEGDEEQEERVRALSDAMEQQQRELAQLQQGVEALKAQSGQLAALQEQVQALQEAQESDEDREEQLQRVQALSDAVGQHQKQLTELQAGVEALQGQTDKVGMEMASIQQAVEELKAAPGPGPGPSSRQTLPAATPPPAIPASGYAVGSPASGMMTSYRNAAFEDDDEDSDRDGEPIKAAAAMGATAAVAAGMAAAQPPGVVGTPLRVRHVEVPREEVPASPPAPGDDASVWDKAVYYEKLAQRGQEGSKQPSPGSEPSEGFSRGQSRETSGGGALVAGSVRKSSGGGASMIPAPPEQGASSRNMPPPASAAAASASSSTPAAAAKPAAAVAAEAATAAAVAGRQGSFSKQHFRRPADKEGNSMLDESIDLTAASVSTDLAEEEDEFDSPPELPGFSGGLSADLAVGPHTTTTAARGNLPSDLFISSGEVGSQLGLSIDNMPSQAQQQARGMMSQSGGLSQSAASPKGALRTEPSGMSSEFGMDISTEAEKIAELLSAAKPPLPPSAPAARDAIQWNTNPLAASDDVAEVQPTRLSFDMADPQRPASESTSAIGSPPEHRPSLMPRPAPGAGVAASRPARGSSGSGSQRVVQGTLDFSSSDEEEEPSSSLDVSRDDGGLAAALGLASSKDQMSMSDSGELEVFAVPSRVANRERGSSSAGPAVASAASGMVSSSMEVSSSTYRVQVVTSAKVGASTTSDAHVTLQGTQGSYEAVLSNPGGAHFQRGKTDEFLIDAGAALGDLTHVHVWHTGQGFGASWCLERLAVEQVLSGLSWEFNINDWIKGGESGGKTFKLGGSRAPSLSRESSAASAAAALAAVSSASGSTPGLPRPGGRPASLVNPSSIGRNAAAYADESFDLSSELTSPGTAGNSLELSGRFGSGAGSRPGAMPGSGQRSRAVSNVPSGIGVVLEEDIEDTDLSLGISNMSSLPGMSPTAPSPAAAVSAAQAPSSPPRQPPPAQQALTAPHTRSPLMRRLSSTSSRREAMSGEESFGAGTVGGGDSTFESLPDLPMGRPPLAPTSLANLPRPPRSSGTGERGHLSGEMWEQGSQISMEGSELDMSYDGSEMSLSMFAEGGIRPPRYEGTRVDYAGTSRKRVSFADYAEQFEFAPSDKDDDDSSVRSITEEELLAAQGLGTKFEGETELSYDDMMKDGNSPRPDSTASTPGPSVSQKATPEPPARRPAGPGQASGSRAGPGADTSPGKFEDVPLGRSARRKAYTYKLKTFTADRMNAGLGNTTVHLELMGQSLLISQALPKAKGVCQRGCVDRFTIYSDSGDMGPLVALKVWHEGRGMGPSHWGLAQIEVEDKVKGIRYVFRPPPEKEGQFLPKGKRHAWVMKPVQERMDESEDLMEVAREIDRQLKENSALSREDQRELFRRLGLVKQRLEDLMH